MIFPITEKSYAVDHGDTDGTPWASVRVGGRIIKRFDGPTAHSQATTLRDELLAKSIEEDSQRIG